MNLEVISRQPESNAKPTPLLFVHGAWHAAWCWDEHFLPYFADKGYAVHALSLRGHGNSEGRIAWSRIKDYAQDVAQVAATFSTPPVVIGHSMGGLVVQKYLEHHAAPAAVLVASNPVHGAMAATLRTVLHNPIGFLKANLMLRLYPIVSSPRHAKATLFSEDFPDDDFMKYHARLQDESYLAYLGMMLLELPRPKRVKTPMLVMGGTDDALFAVWEVVRTARIYGADVKILPDTAHDVMLEATWQTAADVILTWLSERDL